MKTKYLSKLPCLLIIMNLSNNLFSQKLEAYSPSNVSISEYDRAANFFNKNAEQFTSGTVVEPKWIDSDRFWFRNLVFGGHEFILIDIKSKTRSQAFDHSKVAASLSSAKDTTFASNKLPFNSFEYVENNRIIKRLIKQKELFMTCCSRIMSPWWIVKSQSWTTFIINYLKHTLKFGNASRE